MSLSVLIRPLVMAAGAVAVAWSAAVIVVLPRPAAVERVAEKIVSGEPFKPDELSRLLSISGETALSGWERPRSLRGLAIAELREAETVVADGQRSAIDGRLESLGRSLVRALSTAPADPYLWLALYWHDTTVNGIGTRDFGFLDASYRFGPNEGWIGVRRNPFALALYPRLPHELQERAVAEFVGLVESGFSEMPDVFVGAGWAVRDVLLSRLAAVGERPRRAFSRALYTLGYDVAVPGIERPDARPWSR